MTALVEIGRPSKELQAADFVHWHGKELFVAPFDPSLGDYKLVPVSRYGGEIGKVAVSPNKYAEVMNLLPLCVFPAPGSIHRQRPITYRRPIYVIKRGIDNQLHRILLGLPPARESSQFVVNHINGNTFDCRDKNMEVVPRCLNNRKRRRTFIGVPPCNICR